MTLKTPLIIEQHIHGAFGIDFNTANVEDLLFVSEKLLQNGIGGFFPTLVTDTVENIKHQITVIKEAARLCSRILGVHLEGIFINPEKKGIHNQNWFMDLTEENYKLIEDDFIKIITLAPELDKGLIKYLKNKDIKIQAGHCVGGDLQAVSGVTHLYNAMSEIHHRKDSTALSALVDDKIYTEVIADGMHVSDKALNLLFRAKPVDKILLISDALPITGSNIKETFFAGSKIFYDGKKSTSADGTIAGSTTLLNNIIKRLGNLEMFNPRYIENTYNYHNLRIRGEITWDEKFDIVNIDYEGNKIL